MVSFLYLIDSRSVGCVTLELLTGKPPFFDLPPIRAIYNISDANEITYEDTYHNITSECRDFLKECFVKDPERRGLFIVFVYL